MGKNWCKRMVSSLIEAGRTISYIETISPSQADSVHKAIKEIDYDLLRREFEHAVRKTLKKLNFKKVKLAIDGTEDPYWGKCGSFNTRAKVHVKSEESWQYISLAIVEPYFVPLMSIPYRQVDDLDEITIDLIKYAKTLPFEIELVLFDRGFYHAKLIDFLENRQGGKPTPYLILAPKNSKIKEYLSLSKEKVNSFHHEFKYSQDKSGWKPTTKIVTCMNIPWKPGKKPLDWCFATNQRSSLELIRIYKKRWNIETGFRIHDEARVKTKSSNPLIRYFYHLFSMVLILAWRVRMSLKGLIVFKRFLRIVEFTLREQVDTAPT
tara:strand:+ start:77 stop:1042 length:966 start_codon:yes stop_codon:yes gene_type:complete